MTKISNRFPGLCGKCFAHPCRCEKKPITKELILSALKAHLKTKRHRRPDLDHYIGKKLKKVYLYNNGWGGCKEEGFEEAIKVIKKLKL